MELIDYVTNTPQNTNKAILKQLANDEKNKAVYESVEQLKKEGGVGYAETSNVELYSAKGLVLPYVEVDNHMTLIAPVPFRFVAGQTYTVEWNGVVYETVAVSPMDGMVIIGDLESAGTMPFLAATFAEDGVTGLLLGANDDSMEDITVDVSISTVSETIHPIDGKYLPTGTPWIEETGIVEVLPEITLTFDADAGGFFIRTSQTLVLVTCASLLIMVQSMNAKRRQRI